MFFITAVNSCNIHIYRNQSIFFANFTLGKTGQTFSQSDHTSHATG